MPKEMEPSCLDERQQLWWGAGSESYISIGNMIRRRQKLSKAAMLSSRAPVKTEVWQDCY